MLLSHSSCYLGSDNHSLVLVTRTEPTKIIVPPLSVDATVGQSLVLPCGVSSDSTLSLNFKWYFNGKAVDFRRQEHFEMVGGVCTSEAVEL